jgi:hypothetical protein
MYTVTKKTLILFCIFTLINPFLYAQNDAILPTVIPLPKQETLHDAIIATNILPALTPLPGKETVYQAILSTVTPFQEKGSMAEDDYNKLSLAEPLFSKSHYGQAITITQPYKKKNQAFFDFIDKKVSETAQERQEEKKLIREQWKYHLGIDIWYPYFKSKEIEDWICDRTKVEIFHLKGRVKLENKQLRYTFKIQF